VLVKFIKEGRVERAPRNPLLGGYEIDVYPVGHIMEMNRKSFEFWESKGCVEQVRRVKEVRRVEPVRSIPEVRSAPEAEVRRRGRPPSLRTRFLRISEAIEVGNDVASDLSELVPFFDPDDAVFADVSDDSKLLMLAAIEDSKNGSMNVNSNELKEAAVEIADVLTKKKHVP
jgi:hypothetical protein